MGFPNLVAFITTTNTTQFYKVSEVVESNKREAAHKREEEEDMGMNNVEHVIKLYFYTM